MTIVSAALYRDGRRIRDVALDEPVRCGDDRTEFVWIGVADPTEDELRTLQHAYDLHELSVEDALRPHEMPKVDVYGEELFVVARTAFLEEDGCIHYGETAVFVGAHHVISVRHGSPQDHGALRRRLEAAPTLLSNGVDYVLHAILDFIVDGYAPVVEKIEEEVLAMEHRALDTLLGPHEIRRIFTLRRELARFERKLDPTADVVQQLMHLDLPFLDAEVRPYFADVLDHVKRVDVLVVGLRDVLSSVFEVSTLLEQQRQGEITRKLAAWAAILAVPTAIAGIYGMNFEHMPELKTQYGYFVVLAVMATICTGLYAQFRRTGWL